MTGRLLRTFGQWARPELGMPPASVTSAPAATEDQPLPVFAEKLSPEREIP